MISTSHRDRGRFTGVKAAVAAASLALPALAYGAVPARAAGPSPSPTGWPASVVFRHGPPASGSLEWLVEGNTGQTDGVPLAPQRRLGGPGSGASPLGASPTDTVSPTDVASPTPTTSPPPTPVPFTFKRSGYAPQAVPQQAAPYEQSSLPPLVDTGVHDSSGVRMISIGGTLYDHPVNQAAYGIDLLHAYQVTGDQTYLDRAKAQADRLVQNKVASGPAWFFPYTFDFALHGGRDVERAPWYSAMAQGLALTLFSRLSQLPDGASYRTAADATFESLLVAPQPSQPTSPYVVHVDASGFLWLEEYPFADPASSDLTFNGHMFATNGVWEYARLTGDSRAAALFDGAETTVRHYGQSGFPRYRWISAYCLRHAVLDAHYHAIVVTLLYQMHPLTGDSLFARLGDIYLDAYPTPTLNGTVQFSSGTHTAYRFSSTGALLSSKRLVLSRPSAAPATARSRIQGRGIYLLISAGVFSGYWVAESPGSQVLRGQYLTTVFRLPRIGTVQAGISTGYAFDRSGNVLGRRSYSFAAPSSAPVDRTAVINSVLYDHVTAGGWAGYWVAKSVMPLS